MKKFATTALCVAIAASMAVPAFGAELKSFRDVPQSHWAHRAIMEMVSAGRISGVEAPDANGVGRFAPDQTMTRAQFISIIVRTIASADPNAPGDPWYAGAYKAAVRWGVVNEATFPMATLEQPMTREEMADVLVNGCSYIMEDCSMKMPAESIPDFHKVNPDFASAVQTAYMKGLLVGVDNAGSFDPKGTLTRAAASLVIARFSDEEQRIKVVEETPVPVIPAQPVVEEEVEDYWGEEECEEEGWMEDVTTTTPIQGLEDLDPEDAKMLLEILNKDAVTLGKTEDGRYVVSINGGAGTKESASDEIKTGMWVEGEKHTIPKEGDIVIKKDGTKVVLTSTKIFQFEILGWGQGVDFVTGTTVNGHTKTKDKLGRAWSGYGAGNDISAWAYDPISNECHTKNEWAAISASTYPTSNGAYDGEIANTYYKWHAGGERWMWTGPKF